MKRSLATLLFTALGLLLVGTWLVMTASHGVAEEPKPAAAVAPGATVAPAAPAPAKTPKIDPNDASPVPSVLPRQGVSETIELFNGKDFTGWHGHVHRWSIKDGVIVAKSDDTVPVSTYLLTDRKFSDFRLRLKAKLVTSEMHSGVALWGRQAPEQGDPFTFAGHLVMFPSGWGLYDLFGRAGLSVDTAPAKKAGHQHDWNDMEILALGNRIRLVVNGTLVLDWRDPQVNNPKVLFEGPIGLQLHQNKVPQELHFKDLVLTTFPEDKLETMKENGLATAKDEKKPK